MDANLVFKWCVETLEFYAKRWNITYEELNVWIFCIIEPIVFLVMLLLIFKLIGSNTSLRKSLLSFRKIQGV